MRLLLPRKKRANDQDRASFAQQLADPPPYFRAWLGRAVLAAALLSLSSPVELAVPVIRALLRVRGVQTGVAFGSLLSFLAGEARFTAIVRRPDPEGARDHWLDSAILSGAVILPVVGAIPSATVVLRRRSPLWGLGLWLLVRLLVSVVMAVEASRLHKRREADAENASATAADGAHAG